VAIAAREGFRVTGSNAATSVTGDDVGMGFEGPVSDLDLPFQRVESDSGGGPASKSESLADQDPNLTG
jgi:hypothetical protein